MLTYSELIFKGNKEKYDAFKTEIPNFVKAPWKFTNDNRTLRDYILFDYTGSEVDAAEVSIYYGSDSWRKESIKVTNIVPLEKSQLSISEYNEVLYKFYEDVIKPYSVKHPELKIEGPTSDVFNPLNVISEEALEKLRTFSNAANKSTGSSHPSDEERWYDFVCQTVDDDRLIDVDTLAKFLMDEDYWGKKDERSIGVMGTFAWSEEMAWKLASEYEQLTSVLQYYKRTRGG